MRFIINAWCYSDGTGAVQLGNGLLESESKGLLPTKVTIDSNGNISIPPILEDFYEVNASIIPASTITFQGKNAAALDVVYQVFYVFSYIHF